MYVPIPNQAESIEELRAFLNAELQRIADLFAEFEADSIRYRVHNTEPAKPAQGQVYFADGSNWNPGYGEGPYVYFKTKGWVPMFFRDATLSHRINKTTLSLTGFAPNFHVTRPTFSVSGGNLTLTGLAPTVSVN